MTHLTIGDILDIYDGAQPPAFSALTASSRLQVLQLQQSDMGVHRRHDLREFPPEPVRQHVFPTGLVLLMLRHLVLECRLMGSSLYTIDVEQMVCCCPALQSLSLYVGPNVQLLALLQLMELEHLFVGGVDSHAATVVQLHEQASFTVEVVAGRAGNLQGGSVAS